MQTITFKTYFFSNSENSKINSMACFSDIPEDCISRILSLTSPKDVCTILMVSKEFRKPAECDVVWYQFLPNDISNIISSTCDTIPFKLISSKKELFFFLSHQYILIDNGFKAFKLEKSTGRKSYVLSARDLSILHGDVETNWNWKSIQESRFAEVAELKTIEMLQIHAQIKSQTLTPNTTYAAHLIFKISNHAYGLDSIPFEVSISLNDTVLTAATARLRDPNDVKKRHMESLVYGNRMRMMKERVNNIGGDEKSARKRGDGWLEIEVGEFFVGENGEGILKLSVMEVKGCQLKGGLIVEGIEVMPI